METTIFANQMKDSNNNSTLLASCFGSECDVVVVAAGQTMVSFFLLISTSFLSLCLFHCPYRSLRRLDVIDTIYFSISDVSFYHIVTVVVGGQQTLLWSCRRVCAYFSTSNTCLPVVRGVPFQLVP
jgi:hypothetical protein